MAASVPSPELPIKTSLPRGKKLALAAVCWMVVVVGIVLYFALADTSNVWADAFPAIALGAIFCLRRVAQRP